MSLRQTCARLTLKLANQRAAFLHQWPSTSAVTSHLSKLDVNRELEGVDWSKSARDSMVIGQNYFLLGSRRFGFPRGTKPKPRHIWDKKDLEEQTKGEYTHKPLILKKLGGRDPETKQKVTQHIGGGVKFDYFMTDLHRSGPKSEGSYVEERVLEVRRDPNQTAFIALVAGTKGKRWIIASENMQAGQIIKTTGFIPTNPIRGEEGNAHPVGALATGTVIHCIEKIPGNGAELIRNAGGAATIVRRHEGMVIVKLPDKREFMLKPECMCVVGRVSNPGWKKLIWGSAQMHRRFGYRPRSGLWHRKTGYDGRKIRPLPPPIVPNEAPVPRESYKVTLTLAQLSALFGTAVMDNIGRGEE